MEFEDLFTPFDWITPLKALFEQEILGTISDVATDDFAVIEYLQRHGIKCTNIQKLYSIKMRQWVWMCSVPRQQEQWVRYLLERLRLE